jgi:hypothetical protein
MELGTSQSFLLTFLQDDDSPVVFDGTEVMLAEIWPGSSYATLATPNCVWTTPGDPTLGLAVLTVAASDTAGLDPAAYRIRVTIPEQSRLLWKGTIAFTASPGSTPLPPTYCSYADMSNLWPEIEQFSSDLQATQYLFQRSQARKWLEEIIQRSAPRTRYEVLTSPKYGPWIWYGEPGTDPVLQGYLDSNLLVVTDRVKNICAKKALSLALATTVGVDSKTTAYQQAGRVFKVEAEAQLCGLVVEIDLNPQDGYSDFRIAMGVTSTR